LELLKEASDPDVKKYLREKLRQAYKLQEDLAAEIHVPGLCGADSGGASRLFPLR
jgi:hypothetical protein